MKKSLMMLTLFFSVFLLGACEFGNQETGIRDAWYDQESEILNISYNLPETKVEEGQELPFELLTLEGKHVDAEEWFVIDELDQFDAENIQIEHRFEDYGDIEIRVVLRDEAGNILRETDSYQIYVNQPQYIYHFNAHFDSWSGAVKFDFDVNRNAVKEVVFEKSTDGGLLWEEVMKLVVEQEEDGYIKNQVSYFEYDEGNYVYRMIAFSELGEELHMMNAWGETNVWYDDYQYEGEAEIHNVNAWVDTYSQQVNLWWDAFGDFDTVIIEKTEDMVSFEFVKELPRFAQSFNYQETKDGYYYYRVSAVKDGVTVFDLTMLDPLRVKEGAVIGSVDGWIDYGENRINLNWNVRTEEVKAIFVERKSETSADFELLGEFGNLKSSHEDKDLPAGKYIYRISATNEDGLVIDSIETKMFEIEPPELVYNLNAYFDSNAGVVNFYFSVDTERVEKVLIERSKDGGATYEEVVLKELEEFDGWVKQEARYVEFEEGDFRYRLTGFNEFGEAVGTVDSYDHVNISFEYLNLQEPTEIYYFDASSDIYNSYVSLWWDSQGRFERFVIYKTTDMIVWEKVVELPRFSSNYNFEEMLDGNYYFKIEARDSEGVVLDEFETEYHVRVKHDAVLGHINIWEDWYNSEVNVNWEMLNEENVRLVLERKIDDAEYEVIGEFDGFTKQFTDEIYLSGTYQYRVSVFNEFDTLVDQLESREIDFDAPNQLYHFNAYFNWGPNDIRINFGLNEQRVTSYVIEKSGDGGLNWEVIFDELLEFDEDHYKSNISYYEFEEGQFVYRMKVFNEDGIMIGSQEGCCEVVVDFDNVNLEGEVEIFDHNAYYNIWNQEVQLWWHSQGDYYGHLVEKSLDGETWEEVATIPRFSNGFTYIEEIDGVYFYRVSAVTEDGTVLFTRDANNHVRVKEDALIGNLNAYVDWQGEVEVYWDLMDEDVVLITVERKLIDSEYTLLGEFGHLKRTMVDQLDLSGIYMYRVTLYDSDGNMLDQLETDSIEYQVPNE